MYFDLLLLLFCLVFIVQYNTNKYTYKKSVL